MILMVFSNIVDSVNLVGAVMGEFLRKALSYSLFSN